MSFTAGGKRWTLDQLVARMIEPDFVMRYRRAPSFRWTSGHVSPAILALESPRSKYVRAWRKHARTCPICANAYRFLGLSID